MTDDSHRVRHLEHGAADEPARTARENAMRVFQKTIYVEVEAHDADDATRQIDQLAVAIEELGKTDDVHVCYVDIAGPLDEVTR